MSEVTSPDDFLAKIDWEGWEGIEWFSNNKFEDQKLHELVQQAYESWIDFKDDIQAALDLAEELVEDRDADASDSDS